MPEKPKSGPNDALRAPKAWKRPGRANLEGPSWSVPRGAGPSWAGPGRAGLGRAGRAGRAGLAGLAGPGRMCWESVE